jgi:hypothetical protein
MVNHTEMASVGGVGGLEGPGRSVEGAPEEGHRSLGVGREAERSRAPKNSLLHRARGRKVHRTSIGQRAVQEGQNSSHDPAPAPRNIGDDGDVGGDGDGSLCVKGCSETTGTGRLKKG